MGFLQIIARNLFSNYSIASYKHELKVHLIVIPWARVVYLIYTPEAQGLRVYTSGKP